jgi:hypothetical protein
LELEEITMGISWANGWDGANGAKKRCDGWPIVFWPYTYIKTLGIHRIYDQQFYSSVVTQQ